MIPRIRRARTGRMLCCTLAVATAALVPLSCFSDRNAVIDPGDDVACILPAGAIGPDRQVVFIRSFSFSPDTVRIRPGTTVVWVNCEPANVEAHTSTADNQAWNSGLIQSGGSYAREFPTSGTFGYFCLPHPFMRGAVIVQ